MKRRNRLSRSRDFDAVYRKGRSVSTRYLTVYTFPREELEDVEGPRVGFAVSRKVGGAVARNRLKRRLRAAWDEVATDARTDSDYVLSARPGLVEAVEQHGAGWLRGQVAEALGLAAEPAEGASA